MSEHPPPREAHWPEGAVFTVGHSTLPIERFIALLHTYGIKRLVDIRTMPRSRHNPQFNGDSLGRELTGRRYRICALSSAGRFAARAQGFSQYRLAQQKLSRLCRLHAKRGVSGRARNAHWHEPRKNAPRSCARKPCRGAATARWSPTRLLCAAYRSSRFYRRAATACIS